MWDGLHIIKYTQDNEVVREKHRVKGHFIVFNDMTRQRTSLAQQRLFS